MISIKNCSEKHFLRVLDDVIVFALGAEGKGMQRHGFDLPLEDQPWNIIADKIGNEFLTGQAVKKIFESTRLATGVAKKELLGAISYLVFYIMKLDEIEVNS